MAKFRQISKRAFLCSSLGKLHSLYDKKVFALAAALHLPLMIWIDSGLISHLLLLNHSYQPKY